MEVKGVKVAPIDVLMKMVRKPVDTSLSETAETNGQPISTVGRAAVEVRGKRGDEAIDYKVVYPIRMYTVPEERLTLFNRFGASNIMCRFPP